jgi:hypothetical protein
MNGWHIEQRFEDKLKAKFYPDKALHHYNIYPCVPLLHCHVQHKGAPSHIGICAPPFILNFIIGSVEMLLT